MYVFRFNSSFCVNNDSEKKSTKKRKYHTKTSTQRLSVTIEVLLHARRQKSLPFLLRGVNLKEKSCNHSPSSSYSSSLSSLFESSETRSIEGMLGSRFKVISEEDKFRYNLPTEMVEYANTHFETYVKETDLKK